MAEPKPPSRLAGSLVLEIISEAREVRIRASSRLGKRAHCDQCGLRLNERWSQSERGSKPGNETYCIHVCGACFAAKFLASSFGASSNNQMTLMLHVCKIDDRTSLAASKGTASVAVMFAVVAVRDRHPIRRFYFVVRTCAA